MQHATTKSRSLIITVCIGGLVLAYAFLIFLPTRKAIAKMHSELDEKRTFIVATQQDYTEIGRIQQDLDRSMDWVETWQQNSPKRNNLGAFFGRIAEISSTSGTRIERITPEELAELKSLSRHPVRLVVGGSFTQLFGFVQALENMPFTVWIERLQIRTNGKPGENLTCELKLAVFTDNQGISD